MASIFVNRLQFAPHEDFDTYPRTFEHDCDLLRAPAATSFSRPARRSSIPSRRASRCSRRPRWPTSSKGHFRPGFFTGVCTVVLKLFNCVQPRVAVFGKKDYQQLMVIRRMVRQLALPIEIVAGETMRAEDGLALSSRNGYLDASQRAEAVRCRWR